MDYSALIGGLFAGLVMLIPKLIEWYKSRVQARVEEKQAETEGRLKEKKQDADVSIPVNEQAVRVYKDIVDSLRQDTNKLVESMHSQDNMLLKCREEKVELKAEKDAAGRELESMKHKMAELEARLAAQEKKV